MKYAITGGAGHISKPLAESLLAAGHQVTVIGRNPENLKPLTDRGATAAIGSVEDVDFLKQAFTGADAVYTMVPPTFAPTDWQGHIEQVAQNYAAAIAATNVRFVVNLSSIGAHLPHGAGPVSGLYRAEQALNSLPGVSIRHLRPGYFFQNYFNDIALIKQLNIIGGNYGTEQNLITLVHTNDIAAVAAEELLNLNFTGTSIRYIVSDERTPAEIAKVLGAAVGKPELPWVSFSDEQALEGMIQAGLPQEVARNYVEMGAAIRTGIMLEDYFRNKQQQPLAPTKLEDFAQEFAAAYQQEEVAVA